MALHKIGSAGKDLSTTNVYLLQRFRDAPICDLTSPNKRGLTTTLARFITHIDAPKCMSDLTKSILQNILMILVQMKAQNVHVKLNFNPHQLIVVNDSRGTVEV